MIRGLDRFREHFAEYRKAFVLIGGVALPRPEFLIDRSGDGGHHPRPKHLGFPLDLPPIESEIVDAVFQSENSIRGEPVESGKLRYFNSFEFFDHTGSPSLPTSRKDFVDAEKLTRRDI
jgi:hypothetical protein